MTTTRRTTLFTCVLLGLGAATRAAGAADAPTLSGDGVVMVKSAHDMQTTLDRLKADIAAKDLMFFFEVDQSALAAEAGIEIPPSVLLNFGNPALGTLFVQAKPQAGLDWPVRLLVSEDAGGQVWASYTDFAWIAQRHGITNRDAEFRKASEVIASIASSVTGD
jgi:uncharacterized protein (DUF302 family)